MRLSPGCSSRGQRALVLVLLLVSVFSPLSAEWADPLWILFPRIKIDSSSMTSLAIANPTGKDATVILLLVGNDGKVVRQSPEMQIPAKTQVARQVTELFPGLSQIDGCLLLGSTNISVVGFFLTYNLDLGNHQIDGAEAVVLASGLSSTVIFPELTAGPGEFTEISVFTIPKNDLKVTLSLYRASGGYPVQTKQVTIPGGGGRFVGRVNEIFTGSIPSPGYVTATADAAGGVGLVGYEHFGNDRAFGGRNAIAAPLSAREIPFSLFGAQLAEGFGYTSEVTLINPTDRAATVNVSAFRTGAPSSPGVPPATASRRMILPAHGMVKQRAKTLLDLPAGDFVGWLRVDSDIAGVVGDVTFGDANSTPQRFLSSVQLQSSPLTDFVFSHVADGMGFITGLTFLNINPDPADVHLEVYDVNGKLTGSNDFVLQPYEHGPRTLTQIIPGFKPQIGGYVRVSSDVDIFAFELFLYIPSGQVISLAAVPPQRGNGTMSGVLIPAIVGGAGLPSALTLMKPQATQKYPASAAKGIKLDERLEFMPGEMIVELRSSAGPEALDQLARRHGMRVKVNSPNRVHLLESTTDGGVSLVRAGAGGPEVAAVRQSTLQAIEALNLEPDVVYAEPNYISHPCGEPSDPYYGHQWHYPYIKLPAAWDITTGSADTVVAVIDTGAKYSHPDLSSRLAGPGYDYDFITDPQVSLDGDGPDPDADDTGDDPNKQTSSYHGSHVAGTIGAATNNGVGLAGVNWSCRLMILRVLGAGGGTDYDVSQAILYAARKSNATGKLPVKAAKVINLSLSSDGTSTTERNAIQAALDSGVIVVAAAGNKNSPDPRYPAAFPGVIAVGATDLSGELAPYSNYGSHISVVAPGGNTALDLNNDGYVDGVLSCGWKQDTDKPSYVFYQGTSMAAPHVTGIVSLLLAKNPNLTPALVKQYLQETAIDLGASGKDDRYGYGLVDPVESLRKVMGVSSGPPQLVVSTDTLDFGYTQTELIVTVSNGGGGTLSINQPTWNAPWLSKTSLAGAVLTVRVERGTLAKGNYTGTVTIASNGGSATINVLMKVGTPTAPGNLGTIYILALDPRTLETAGYVDSDDPRKLVAYSDKDGGFKFQFPPLFAGYYFVIAGNNPDDDGWICEDGEYCGLYPVSSQLSLVQIRPNEDTPGINFVLEKPTAPASLSLLEELRLRTGKPGFALIRNVLTGPAIERSFRQKLTVARAQ